MLDVHRREQAVAHVGGDRQLAVRGHQVVHRCRNVVRRDRRFVGDQPARVLRAHHRALHSRLAGARQQRIDQRRQRDLRIDVVPQPHLAVVGDDGLAQVDLLLRDGEVGIRKDYAEQEQPVRVLHQLRHFRQPGHAHVGADQRRIRFHEQAAPHEAGRHRQRQPARQFRHLRLQAVTAHFHIDHQHRPCGRCQPLQHLVGAGRERLGIDRRRSQRRHGSARHRHHVARDLDVHRPRMFQAVAEHARDVGRRTLGVVEADAVAGDLLEDAELRIERLRLMVQQQAGTRLALARPARDHYQRRLLGIGRRHRVDHVQRPGAVGHRRNAQRAIDARRGIGREADPGLVRERVQRQDLRLFDDAEVRQREVAGNAEDLAGAVGLEGMQQGFGEVHGQPPVRVR